MLNMYINFNLSTKNGHRLYFNTVITVCMALSNGHHFSVLQETTLNLKLKNKIASLKKMKGPLSPLDTKLYLSGDQTIQGGSSSKQYPTLSVRIGPFELGLGHFKLNASSKNSCSIMSVVETLVGTTVDEVPCLCYRIGLNPQNI